LELPEHLEPTAAWREIRAELRRAVGESTYEIWLAPLEVKSLQGTVLSLTAPPTTLSWVARRFTHVLDTCARAVLGPEARVSLDQGASSAGHGHAASAGHDADDRLDAGSDTLNPRYSFDQFIIGDSNRLAHAAALAVAELPGEAYNPLFLHAPPGLGKTHLLHAIGNYVHAFGDGAAVRYATVEAFTNQFINALSSRSLSRFKRAYRDADVLLIDDVQFLASKAKTEEEFFHTFNTLHETGRQLVITCDRLPRQLVAVEERLRERFECGLVVDVGPPDRITRVAILRKRVALDRIRLEDEAVLELIADRITTNVRALEGALIRVVASHSLTGRPMDLELAKHVLDEMYPQSGSHAPSIERIQHVVADQYGLTVPELISAMRTARIAWPRQLAIHLSRELTHSSLPSIGAAFGGRNHSTVLHACKRVSERLKTEPEVSGELAELTHAVLEEQGDRRR
jgi:chromosomal replication initiator protein